MSGRWGGGKSRGNELGTWREGVGWMHVVARDCICITADLFPIDVAADSDAILIIEAWEQVDKFSPFLKFVSHEGGHSWPSFGLGGDGWGPKTGDGLFARVRI